MSYVFKDAQAVRSQILGLVAVYPDLQEDAELLATAVEGETDFERIMAKLLDHVLDAEAFAYAIKARKDAIAERQKRYEHQAAAGRKVMLSLMHAAQADKVTLPEATVSMTKPRASAKITDVDQLPQGYFRNERKPLSKEILAGLQAGDDIPGAEINPGEASITVRVR